MYEVIGLPPVLAGAVHDTAAWLDAGRADTAVGAPGAELPGVTAFDGADAGPEPLAFVAVTVKVYVLPLVRSVIVALVAGGEPETVVVG